jgi:FecR protein
VNEEIPEIPDAPRPPDGLEHLCVGVLRTEFGRKKSRALKQAMIRLTAEQAAVRRSMAGGAKPWGDRFQEWSDRLTPRFRFAFGTALVFVIALAGWLLWSDIKMRRGIPSDPGAICKLSGSLEARWADKSAKPKLGDAMTGILRLESGVVELTYASGVTVAVEGPAQFKVTRANTLELSSGKISANVPKQARGFTVKSPTASVVDLGTRFGEIVNSDRASEVDVFQGQVQLTPVGSKAGGRWQLSQSQAMIVDTRSAVTATALPETAFPQPNLTVLARPQNCGFDASGRAVPGDVPVNFGYWSGPAFALTGPVQKIRPVEGAGMLQFFSAAANPVRDSEVWQLIDLRPFKKFLASGSVEARLSSMFNRIPGGAGAGDTFGLSLAAFRGAPANAKIFWARRASAALAQADQELITDDDPGTWEKIEVSANLPPETEFVIVDIRALAPKGTDPTVKLFPGHFADLVDFKLCTPLRASSIDTSR